VAATPAKSGAVARESQTQSGGTRASGVHG
jgi:hypothetical protein